MSGLWKFVLVGCGGVAKNYRGVYGNIPGARVTLTVDIMEAEARSAQAEVKAERFSTLFADAVSSDADVAVLTTPNDLHLPQAVALLEAGKNVLLQKPIARTAAEAEQIVQAAERTGKQLAIYMNSLDHPLFHDLRDMALQGYFGRIAKMRALLAHNQGLSWTGDIWRASKERTGGGSFIQLAVHYIHLLQWISGLSVRSAYALGGNLMCPHLEGDDMSTALLEMDTGAIAEIGSGWCYNGEEVSIMAEKATVQYLNNDTLLIKAEKPYHGRIIRYETPGEWLVATGVAFPRMGDTGNPLEQHRMNAERLMNGEAPMVSGRDGWRDMKIVDAVHESMSSGQRVILQ